MGTEQQQEQQNGQGGGAAGGGGAAANGEGAPRGQAFGTASRAPLFSQQQGGSETQEQPAAPAGGATPPKTGRTPITLPDGALRERLQRAERKGAEGFLKLLGAKDEAEAKEKLAKLTAAEQEAEKRRLAEMGELERVKAELEAERQKSAALEQRLAEYESQREHEQHAQTVQRVASEVVDGDALPLFELHLAQHIKNLAKTNPELAEKFGERGVKRFAEKWIAKYPKYAKTAGAAPVVEQPKPGPTRPAAPGAKPGAPVPVRRPVTTGAPPRRNPAPPVQTTGPSAMANGKTARPGQKNSMTPAEVKAFAAANGVNYNPV